MQNLPVIAIWPKRHGQYIGHFYFRLYRIGIICNYETGSFFTFRKYNVSFARLLISTAEMYFLRRQMANSLSL